MKSHTKKTFQIFWQHVMNYRLAFAMTIVAVVLGNVLRLFSPIYYKRLFDGAATGTALEALFSILGVIFLIELGNLIAWRFAFFFASYYQSRTMRDLASSCYAYLQKHSTSFFNNNFVGSLTKRVNRFYRAFEAIFDRIQWDVIPIVITIVMVDVIFSMRSLLLGGLLACWLMFYCVANWLFTRYKLKYDIERSSQDSRVTGILADTITNHQNVKLFGGYRREHQLFYDQSTKLNDMRRFAWDISTAFEGFQIFLMLILELACIWITIKMYRSGAATIGDLFMVQAYLSLIFRRLWDFGRVIRDFYEQLAEAEEMTEILEEPHEIQDRRNAKDLLVTDGEIVFDHVQFNYHKTRSILPSLDLTIPAGQKVALVGTSGAGKSTIVKLLLRNHDVSKGSVLIDGQDIARVTQDSLWHAISLVPQDPVLFHRSLMENIRYGRPEASDEEVLAAAEAAHCHEFISDFPEKYDTLVGERGVKLSGGERQRIAIARAILRDAPILILDEATSSLDSESEYLIQDALDTLMMEKTVIVVAHRLSTIMQMDRIIVLDQGRILEDGTHRQLVRKKNGMYAKLWKIQAGGFAA